MNSPLVQRIDKDGFAVATGPGVWDKTEQLVASIIKKEFDLEVTGFEPIVGRGMSNTVFIVNTEESRYVVRLNQVARALNFEKEAWCLDKVHELGVLVPRVIAVGIEGERAYSIARYIESSSPIHDGFDKLRLWNTLGEYAAKLNSVDVQSYPNQQQLKSWFGSWESFIAREIEIIFRDDYWVDCGFLSLDELQTIKGKFEKFATTDFCSGICHWDIGLDNCIVANNSYEELYMLDLEFAMIAPVPHYQLAVVGKTWGFESPEMKAFSDGYGISAEQREDMAQDFKTMAALLRMRSVRWAQDRSPGEVKGRLEDTRGAISELLGN